MLGLVEFDDLAPIIERLTALESAAPPPASTNVHHSISLADFSAVNDGSADVSDAWAAMLAASREWGLPTIAPRGVYRFDHRPDQIDHCISFSGQGASNTGTMFVKNYATEPGGDTLGLIDFRPGSDGSSFGHVFIKNETPGGCLITAKASPALTMTNLSLHDLNLSTSDTAALYHVILFDGSLKTTGAKGCRVNSLRNVVVFGAQWASVALKSCCGLWWHGGAIYPAGSNTPYSGALIVSGTAEAPSYGIRIDIQTAARLSLERMSAGRFDFVSLDPASGDAIENTSFVSNVRGRSLVSGAIQPNWISSSWTTG